jgi:hypothetical protein
LQLTILIAHDARDLSGGGISAFHLPVDALAGFSDGH